METGSPPAGVPPLADRWFIERLQADDERALALLMERFIDEVAAIAYHTLRSSDLTNEAVQAVFIGLWNRRQSLDPSGNLAYYLRRSARNAALKVRRQEAGVERVAQQAASEATLSIVSDMPAVLGQIEKEEFRQQVRRILGGVSPRVREVALLHYHDGMAPGEIASSLRVAPRTIYNQLRTALRALTEGLQADAG